MRIKIRGQEDNKEPEVKFWLEMKSPFSEGIALCSEFEKDVMKIFYIREDGTIRICQYRCFIDNLKRAGFKTDDKGRVALDEA